MEKENNKNFTHLHLHTSYSVLDGMCKLEELIPRAKELGMSSLAITDHNHLGGTYQFQLKCQEYGIKPILGYEAYYTDDTSILSLPSEERNKMAADKALKAEVITNEEYKALFSKGTTKNIKKVDVKKKIEPYAYSTKQYHIIFIAMNQTGWHNIIKLQSESAEKCTFNGRFLCDNDLIRKYNEGIICTTACIANRIARFVKTDQTDKAEELLKEWHDIFQDRFYLEMQPLAMEEQVKVNAFYIKMAAKYNLPLIATNDVHYIYKEDHDDHDTLLCIGTGKFKSDYNRMKYTNDFWLRSYDEMIEAFTAQKSFFKDLLPDNYMDYAVEALENTNRIADRVDKDIKIGSDKPLIPQVKLPKGHTPEQVLTLRCYQNLYKLASENNWTEEKLDKYEKRLAYELSIINPKGFASYFLVIDEYTTWANEHGCQTGPGRGSAAGSLALFLLGVTKVIDPLEYDLLFERFLTKDRTAMPDVDLDFDYYKRDSVIHHLEDYYGQDHVAHIGTYNIMGVKSGIKDVGRVLEIPFDTMNNISKQLDEILDAPQPKFKDFDALKDSDNKNEVEAWKKFNQLEEDNKEIFRLARKFEGLHRNFGVHASGILAMPIPVNDMYPSRIADGVRVCLYTGPEIEETGSIKCDILGLKTVSVINNTLEHINKDFTWNELYKKVNVDDPKVFEMLREKKTDAVFQLESDMFKGAMTDIKPDCLNDIIAITAILRPGPLSAGMPQQFAKRKRGEEEATPLLRGMDDLLKPTKGLILYQEQSMLIGVKAFGFNLNQADSLIRKIFSKKKKDKMEMLRRIIKYGKKNSCGPEGWHDNPNMPWYDKDAKMGDEICGGLANGYSEKEIDDFWNIIQGFSSYLFNLSHSATYSYVSILSAWLKYYYPVQFWAAVLSIQTDQTKIEKYIDVCEKDNISIIVPDINISEHNFTPNADNRTIYYGLDSIKGIGIEVAEELIKNRPYNTIQDLFDKLPKKVFNKRVAMALAKSGALDSLDPEKNRCRIIDTIMEIRKEKKYEPLTSQYYSEIVCMEYEKEVLSAYITYKPWWNTIKANEKVNCEALIVNYREKTDKNNNLMCFADLLINSCEVKSVIFASTYRKCLGLFNEDINFSKKIIVGGTKDDKGSLIIKNVSPVREKTDIVIPF